MSGNDKCGKCDSGTIQHTSFMNDDGVSSTHVYGCNRCENGWSEVDIPNPCKEFGGDSNLYMDVKGREERGTTDPLFGFNVPIANELILRLSRVRVLRSSCSDSNEGDFRVHLPERDWDEIQRLVKEMREGR